MNKRPTISKNVELSLWAESCGHCANPKCRKRLLSDDKKTSIADRAHIEPHSQGGGTSAENLILLCKNCHKSNEPIDRPEVKQKLRQWKADLTQRNKEVYELKFSTFADLAEEVCPLLSENYQIFTDYGPHTENPEVHRLWKLFEPTLVTNNAKIKLMFKKNIDLFHMENQNVVKQFMAHANEFEATRENFDGIRQNLFPEGMLSLFEIEEEPISLAPSVNALHNFIAKLKKEGRFIKLELLPKPSLTFTEKWEKKVLNLEDRARVQQIFFSGRLYHPERTKLRLDNFVFCLQRIENFQVKWKFEDETDLTILTINHTTRIKLYYSYILSLRELESADLQSVSYVANLYNWNGGPITDDARNYAQRRNIKPLTAEEFTAFCRGQEI